MSGEDSQDKFLRFAMIGVGGLAAVVVLGLVISIVFGGSGKNRKQENQASAQIATPPPKPSAPAAELAPEVQPLPVIAPEPQPPAPATMPVVQDSPLPQQSTRPVSREEIAASWSKFVNAARGRIGDAKEHFRQRFKDLGEGVIDVALVSDDVSETTSLKYAAEGRITLRSTTRFGFISEDFTHNLRFGYSDGTWTYLGGNGTSSKKGNFNYPELTASYHRVMFP